MVSPKDKHRPAFQWSDIPTVPNAMSLAGAIMSWMGAEKISAPKGLGLVIAGRAIDALDGPVARKLNQESNFGATVDAGLDKVATTKIIYELWRQDAAPKAVLGTIATLSAINLAATAHTMIAQPGKPIRPTAAGKMAMAGETVALFAYTAAHTAESTGHNRPASLLRKIGNATAMITLPLALRATSAYVDRARQS